MAPNSDENFLSLGWRTCRLSVVVNDLQRGWAGLHFPPHPQTAARCLLSKEGFVLRMVHVHVDGGVDRALFVVNKAHTGKRMAALLARDERHRHHLQPAMDPRKQVMGKGLIMQLPK